MSGETNGNGFKKVEIDVTDEHAFRTGVVQNLQMIADQTVCLPMIKKKVDKHDRIVYVGKWLIIPVLWIVHALLPENHAVKAFLAKLIGG